MNGSEIDAHSAALVVVAAALGQGGPRHSVAVAEQILAGFSPSERRLLFYEVIRLSARIMDRRRASVWLAEYAVE